MSRPTSCAGARANPSANSDGGPNSHAHSVANDLDAGDGSPEVDTRAGANRGGGNQEDACPVDVSRDDAQPSAGDCRADCRRQGVGYRAGFLLRADCYPGDCRAGFLHRADCYSGGYQDACPGSVGYSESHLLRLRRRGAGRVVN